MRRAYALIDRSLRGEEERNLSIAGGIRLAAVTAALLCHLVLGSLLGHPEWRAALPSLAAYWAVSLVLWALVRLRPGTTRAARYGLALVDVPMVFWIQHQSLATSLSPAGVASFTLAVYCALTMLATLTLERRLTAATAAAAIVLDLLLMRSAGTGGGAQVVAAVVLAATAAGGWHLINRVQFLVAQTIHD